MDQLPFRNVSSPLTDDMLAPLRESHQWLQFSSLPTHRELDRIAELLERHPAVGLRAYGGYDGSIRDLDFLAHFPTLRRFRVDGTNSTTSKGSSTYPTTSTCSASARLDGGPRWIDWHASKGCGPSTWPRT